MLTETVDKNAKFALYGAQVVAYGAHIAIGRLCDKSPECFIVSDPAGNGREIDGIPVRTLDRVGKDTLIVVAVSDLLQGEIQGILKRNGYNNIFALDSHAEHLLMSAYFTGIGRFPPLAGKRREGADFILYEAHSKKDKVLTSPPVLKPWEHAVWADDYPKNAQYCEMSAARWIWKNARADRLGLEHYRRHLLVTPKMLDEDTDAVLPLPYLCYPNTLAQLLRFVGKDVLRALLYALKTLYPDKYDHYLRILNGRVQYTYNMLVAKREVYADYCAWLFGITEYMETLGVPEIDGTRALSYCAETLTSIYFLTNADKLKIRHAEKAIYV
jgi:hypothetical protein